MFEEYGFKSEKQDDMFPYSFVNVHGHTQVTGCNDSAIIGDLRLKYTALVIAFKYFCFFTLMKWFSRNDRNTYCTLDQETCHFYPDLNSQQGPSTSLMFMHFLKSVTNYVFIAYFYNVTYLRKISAIKNTLYFSDDQVLR